MPDPFPYQIEGARWLAGRTHALLGDDMGLGKTAQGILASDLVGARRILVVCPAVARFNWASEFGTWSVFSPRCYPVTTPAEWPRGFREGVVIVSYDLAWLAKGQGPWDLVIADEGHYLKNAAAQRSQVILAKRAKGGIVHDARRFWSFSGTFAPNGRADELWTWLHVFGVYRGSYDEFVAEFCEGYWDGYKFKVTGNKPEKIAELRKLLAPIFLRRKKADVLTDLPPITFSDVVVQGTPLGEYEKELSFTNYLLRPGKWDTLDRDVNEQITAVSAALAALDGSPGRTQAALQMLESLNLATATMRRYLGLMKVPAVAELVEQELDNGLDKIVLFCMHRDVIEFLRERLKRFKPVTLYGGTDPLKRENNIRKFQTTEKCRIFIGQVVAAGTAITLTASCNVLFVEASWVPGENAQATMRVHRIGQTRPVLVRFAGMADSIDQRVQRILRKKTKEMVNLFD